MEYLIADLIDNRNRALYDEVALNLPVVLERSDDDGWGEIIKDGKGLIYYAPTQYPISSFTGCSPLPERNTVQYCTVVCFLPHV